MVKINGGDDDKFRLYQNNNLNNVNKTNKKENIEIPIGATEVNSTSASTTSKNTNIVATDAATQEQIDFLGNFR